MRRLYCAILVVGLLWAGVLPCSNGRAANPAVPDKAKGYRSLLTRSAHAFWGLNAPVSTFAAQIHQESLWNPAAVSQAGARGLAQFMPGTSNWISGLYAHLSDNEPHNPAWAIRALVSYDKWLFERVRAVDDCQRAAKMLAAYNGGLGWVYRDEKLAAQRGLDPLAYWESVEMVNAGRGKYAKKENRDYPRRILLSLEPLYVSGGWSGGWNDGWGGGMCNE